MSIAATLGVYGHGMITAVGHDAESTCAAMRAGVHGATTANLWDPTAGKRLQAARPVLHQWWEGATLWPHLAARAVSECLEQADIGATGEPLEPRCIPIVSLLPPAGRPLLPSNFAAGFAEALSHKLGWPLPHGSGTLQVGRTGAVHALPWVTQALRSGAKAVVVVGVESFLRQAIVNHYLDAGRLLCGANSNGFVPGEAACAVLMAPAGRANVPCLQILGIGLEREVLAVKGMAGQATRSEAMSRAWRCALTQAGVHFYDIAFSLSDLNGERFKFKEAAFAAARLDRVPPERRSRRGKGFAQMWHPSEYLGEIGAAVSPCLLGWTFEAGRRGYAPSVDAMLHSSEDEGERMAIVTRFHSGDRTS